MAGIADSTSSTEKPRAAVAGDGVSLGRVVGAHGLRGELRVRATEDDALSLTRVTSVRLVRDDGDADAREYEVRSVRPGRRGECRVALDGIPDRDSAEALIGRQVLARATELPPLEAGEFYAYELVGCRVVDQDGSEIGEVRRIWDTGTADLLVIEDARGREHLVPAKAPLLREVDVEMRRIVIEALPGLIESE